MNIASLIKHSDFEKPEDLKFEAEVELAKLLGVSHRLFGRKESPFYTKEQIADILVKHALVENLEEGLRETDSLLKNKVGHTEFVKCRNKDGEIRYRLEYVGGGDHGAYDD